jgi:hypothetical protein
MSKSFFCPLNADLVPSYDTYHLIANFSIHVKSASGTMLRWVRETCIWDSFISLRRVRGCTLAVLLASGTWA